MADYPLIPGFGKPKWPLPQAIICGKGCPALDSTTLLLKGEPSGNRI